MHKTHRLTTDSQYMEVEGLLQVSGRTASGADSG